jgi:signal transduction histidine kinase
LSAPIMGNGLLAILHERISEQREVSRFLHDTIAQDLVALAFTLSRLESLALSDVVLEETRSAIALIDGCCALVRTVGVMFASSILDGGVPDLAIDRLAELMRAETGIPVILDLDPPSPMSHGAQTLLLAVVRSCFAMVVRRRAEPAIFIRLRNQEHTVILDIEISPPPPGSVGVWTLFKGCAAALGGEFAAQHNSEQFTASLSLPQEGSVSQEARP